ncbi:MAG: hypothetical protein ACOCQD_00025 [archaeon]
MGKKKFENELQETKMHTYDEQVNKHIDVLEDYSENCNPKFFDIMNTTYDKIANSLMEGKMTDKEFEKVDNKIEDMINKVETKCNISQNKKK